MPVVDWTGDLDILPVKEGLNSIGAINQQISLASLPAGVYTVRLHTTEGTVAKRIVKQ